MPIAASRSVTKHELVDLAQAATGALDALLADAVRKVRDKVVVEGRVVAKHFRPRTTRRAWARLARDLRRGGAAVRPLTPSA